MPRVWIDNAEVEVEPGATLLEAARKLGLDVPALCSWPGQPACTSCMVCVMSVDGRLVPSCATPASDGLRAQSQAEPVLAARRSAIELLLSEHAGDCVGPCQSVCPAGMDIPRMIRQIAAGDLGGALRTVKQRIALPAVLGRICPAPCEKGCRRGQVGDPVAIMLLKRHVADADLAAPVRVPQRAPATGRRVAVVGAGPAGLAAAYYLLQDGHAVELLDDHDQPGGALRHAVEPERLPPAVLDAEIDIIRRLGASFRLGVRVGRDVGLDDLRRQFDAVVLAVGGAGIPLPAEQLDEKGRPRQPLRPGVFAAGDPTHKGRMTVRAVAGGRAAAVAVSQYLPRSTGVPPVGIAGVPPVGSTGVPPVGIAGVSPAGVREFSCRIGFLKQDEFDRFLARASLEPRQAPGVAGVSPASGGEGSEGAVVAPVAQPFQAVQAQAGKPVPPGASAAEPPGYTDDQARSEAARCLKCDCLRADDCRLRQAAQALGAKPARYKGQRRSYELDDSHPDVVYESGKCILCGLCVQIARDAGEELGLALGGRGFATKVAVPFGRPLAEGLRRCAAQCVAACPTGALAFKRRT